MSHRSAATDSLRVVALSELAVDPADGELQAGTRRTRLALRTNLAALAS